jgi:hypothetical protein
MLNIALEPRIAAFLGKTPKIHVPRTGLALIYLSQRRRDKKSCSYGDPNTENVRYESLVHFQMLHLLAEGGLNLRNPQGRLRYSMCETGLFKLFDHINHGRVHRIQKRTWINPDSDYGNGER